MTKVGTTRAQRNRVKLTRGRSTRASPEKDQQA